MLSLVRSRIHRLFNTVYFSISPFVIIVIHGRPFLWSSNAHQHDQSLFLCLCEATQYVYILSIFFLPELFVNDLIQTARVIHLPTSSLRRKVKHTCACVSRSDVAHSLTCIGETVLNAPTAHRTHRYFMVILKSSFDTQSVNFVQPIIASESYVRLRGRFIGFFFFIEFKKKSIHHIDKTMFNWLVYAVVLPK